MSYTITREFHFSAAHRIEGHPKCGRLHGHNYFVVVTMRSNNLDDQSMVMDFGEVDNIVKPLIETLDHRYLVSQSNISQGDPYYAAAPPDDVVPLSIKATTAEMLAEWLHDHIAAKLSNVQLAITVWETAKSSATYNRG